jgi:hypothetical protein
MTSAIHETIGIMPHDRQRHLGSSLRGLAARILEVLTAPPLTPPRRTPPEAQPVPDLALPSLTWGPDLLSDGARRAVKLGVLPGADLMRRIRDIGLANLNVRQSAQQWGYDSGYIYMARMAAAFCPELVDAVIAEEVALGPVYWLARKRRDAGQPPPPGMRFAGPRDAIRPVSSHLTEQADLWLRREAEAERTGIPARHPRAWGARPLRTAECSGVAPSEEA